MKRVTALLLCILLLCTFCVTAFAADPEAENTNAVISVTVPGSHQITVKAEDAKVALEGVVGDHFTVERLSTPRFSIQAERGRIIKSVKVNGVNVTHEMHGIYLDFAPVYEDKVIVVTTEDRPVVPRESYTVKGKVTLNDKPLADVKLELRGTMKTTKTNKDGEFVFIDVMPGKYTLVALKDGKVIGSLEFELKKDSEANIALRDDGTYIISVAENSEGVELHLALDEDKESLVPTDADPVGDTVGRDDPNVETGDHTPLVLCWFLLLLSAAGMVILAIYRRKKAA